MARGSGRRKTPATAQMEDIAKVQESTRKFPYKFGNFGLFSAHCARRDHSESNKTNCAGSPHCLACLNEGKGFWSSKAFILDKLGADPVTTVRGYNKKETLIGLGNLGGTCYANVFLQLLYHNLHFRALLYDYRPQDLDKILVNYKNSGNYNGETLARIKTIAKVVEELQLVFANLQESKASYFTPSGFIEAAGLDKEVHNDSQEFMLMLLGQLMDWLEALGRIDLTRRVSELYKGGMQICIRCKSCNGKSIQNEGFLELRVFIRQADNNIQQMLEAYLDGEDLEGYKCEKCGCCRQARRFELIRHPPPILFIHICRFTRELKKLVDPVRLDEEIDITDLLVDKDGNRHLYNLTTVVSHKGEGTKNGHMVVDCKDTRGRWMTFDDTKVTQTSAYLSPEGKKAKGSAASGARKRKNKKGEIIETTEDSDVEILEAPDGLKGKSQKKDRLSTEAYMLVYIKDGFQEPTEEQLRVPDYVKRVVDTANAQLGNAVEDYSKNKAKLEEEIETRKALYETYFEAAGDGQPLASPPQEGGAHAVIPTKWLMQWVTGENEADLDKSTRGRKKKISSEDVIPSPDHEGIDGPDKEEAAGGTEDKASESGKEGETDVESPFEGSNAVDSVTQKTESQDGELCHPKGFKLFSGPIINKPYACPHGRLDPVHARSMKVVSEAFWNELTDQAGGGITCDIPFTGYSYTLPEDGVPRSSYYCPECVQKMLAKNKEILRDTEGSLAIVQALAEQEPVKPEMGCAYLVTKKWASSFSSLQKENIKAILAGDFPPYDLKSEDVLEQKVNSAITCEHDQFRGTKAQFRYISAEGWDLIKAMYKDAIPYVVGQEMCSECKQEEAEKKEKTKALKEERVVSKLLQMVRDRKAWYPKQLIEAKRGQITGENTPEKDNGNIFPLVERQYLENWRNYLSSIDLPRPQLRPAYKELACEHGKILLSPFWEKVLFKEDDPEEPAGAAEIKGFPEYELLTLEEWDALVNTCSEEEKSQLALPSIKDGPALLCLNVGHKPVGNGGSEIIVSEVCYECMKNRREEVEINLSNFSGGTLSVITLKNGEEVPGTDSRAGAPKKGKRLATRSRRSIEVTNVASTDQIGLLKLKISELSGIQPWCQTVYYEGTELEDTKRLEEFKIKADSVLYLREKKNIPDEDQEAYYTTFLPIESGGGNNEKFQAFRGTVFEALAPPLPSTFAINLEDDDVNDDDGNVTLEAISTPSRSNSQVSTPIASPPTDHHPFSRIGETEETSLEPSLTSATEPEAITATPQATTPTPVSPTRANSAPSANYSDSKELDLENKTLDSDGKQINLENKTVESDSKELDLEHKTVNERVAVDALLVISVPSASRDPSMPEPKVEQPQLKGEATASGESVIAGEVGNGSAPVKENIDERPRRKRGRCEQQVEEERHMKKQVLETIETVSPGTVTAFAGVDKKQEGEGEEETKAVPMDIEDLKDPDVIPMDIEGEENDLLPVETNVQERPSRKRGRREEYQPHEEDQPKKKYQAMDYKQDREGQGEGDAVLREVEEVGKGPSPVETNVGERPSRKRGRREEVEHEEEGRPNKKQGSERRAPMSDGISSNEGKASAGGLLCRNTQLVRQKDNKGRSIKYSKSTSKN